MTGRQAIEHVLDGKRKPLAAKAITSEAVKLTAMKGKTPEATLAALLYTEAKKKDGLVTKVGRGEFKLNPKRKTKAAPAVEEQG